MPVVITHEYINATHAYLSGLGGAADAEFLRVVRPLQARDGEQLAAIVLSAFQWVLLKEIAQQRLPTRYAKADVLRLITQAIIAFPQVGMAINWDMAEKLIYMVVDPRRQANLNRTMDRQKIGRTFQALTIALLRRQGITTDEALTAMISRNRGAAEAWIARQALG
jgi:hypothetical protein